MAKILIVEDHSTLRTTLHSILQAEGFEVEMAEDLAAARQRLKPIPDLILLDWMLPDGQGIDLLSTLPKSEPRAAVIILSARADTIDKVLGLEMGAHDYITKPFEPRELIARVRARLRDRREPTMTTQPQNEILSVGSLTIDRIKHKVRFHNADIELVRKEFALLLLFAENPERVFSRDEILNKVWGYDIFPTTRTVDTHVMLLRQKIHNDLIETVRAVGYRLKPLS
ncbi:MAG: response regulator transcription factor [Bdellovibrionaceae bacterium]|nr:response regulator transcription factor [Pseudobdellovibrionaceae bacterium]